MCFSHPSLKVLLLCTIINFWNYFINFLVSWILLFHNGRWLWKEHELDNFHFYFEMMSLTPNLNLFSCAILITIRLVFLVWLPWESLWTFRILEEYQMKLFYELRPPILSKNSSPLYMLSLAINCAFYFVSFEHSWLESTSLRCFIWLRLSMNLETHNSISPIFSLFSFGKKSVSLLEDRKRSLAWVT